MNRDELFCLERKPRDMSVPWKHYQSYVSSGTADFWLGHFTGMEPYMDFRIQRFVRAPQSPAGSGDLAAPGESVTLAEEDVNAD